MVSLYLSYFLITPFYNLWYILSATVTNVNDVTVKCLMQLVCWREIFLLIEEKFLPRLFLRLNKRWVQPNDFRCSSSGVVLLQIWLHVLQFCFVTKFFQCFFIIWFWLFKYSLSEVFNDLWLMIWWAADVC